MRGSEQANQEGGADHVGCVALWRRFDDVILIVYAIQVLVAQFHIAYGVRWRSLCRHSCAEWDKGGLDCWNDKECGGSFEAVASACEAGTRIPT